MRNGPNVLQHLQVKVKFAEICVLFLKALLTPIPYFAASLRFGEADITSELLKLLFVMLTDVISTIRM